ncbi:MAG: hypothetical protein II625_10180 [Bacilli bacterium]|nr:hypothetical protein [Bacilli bacterium]
MKKIRVITFLLLIVLVLVGCDKVEKYEVDKTTTLKGKIIINTIKDGEETKNVSILELEKAISIDGVITDKIEIEYDKSLKNNSETTITGILKANEGSTDLKYSIAVDSVDNILSYINNFSNDIFSLAIPPKLMKSITVKEINNGFIIYSSKSEEAFKIIAIPADEYKELSKNDFKMEVARNNKQYYVVVIYPVEENNSEPTREEQQLYEEIDTIKSSIKLK